MSYRSICLDVLRRLTAGGESFTEIANRILTELDKEAGGSETDIRPDDSVIVPSVGAKCPIELTVPPVAADLVVDAMVEGPSSIEYPCKQCGKHVTEMVEAGGRRKGLCYDCRRAVAAKTAAIKAEKSGASMPESGMSRVDIAKTAIRNRYLEGYFCDNLLIGQLVADLGLHLSTVKRAHEDVRRDLITSKTMPKVLIVHPDNEAMNGKS